MIVWLYYINFGGIIIMLVKFIVIDMDGILFNEYSELNFVIV